jgi:sugar O-acyltransferase (sialic acid O-acetyltransferase NeuD family)
MANVVIFGTGKGSHAAFRYLTHDSPHKVCGFTVDPAYKTADTFNDLPVIGFDQVEQRFPPGEFHMFVPMGFQRMNRLRYEKYSEAKAKGYPFVSYVSSSIPRIGELEIGENCLILQNQSINLDVKIGNNVVMWSGNQIGDNSQIMDNVWISSHVCIAGNVIIKPFCIIGINASISHNVTVGEECFVGANALITQDAEPKGVYVVESTKRSPMTSDRFMAMIKQPD